VLSASRSRADDLSDLQGLLSEQIVTSASKQSEGASSAPALSTNLSADDLQRYGIRSLAEAIDFIAVGLKTSDNLDAGEIGGRGVLLTGDRGKHMLLLVDGHAVNEPLTGGAWFGPGAGIPIELIDHIEVIVGPGSVLYGSNAMFGLINVITKTARDYNGVSLRLEGATSPAYRASVGVGKEFSLFGRSFELAFQGDYYDQSGPDFVLGPQNTGIDRFTGKPGRNRRGGPEDGIWGGTAADKALYARVPSALLTLRSGNFELDLRGSQYTHATPTVPTDFNEPQTRDLERTFSADVKYHKTVSSLLSLAGRLYADVYSINSRDIASRGALCPFGSSTCVYTSDGSARGLGLELQTTWDWLGDGRLVTLLGGDVRLRSISFDNSGAVDIDSGQVLYPPDKGLHVQDAPLSAFLQQTWRPFSALLLNGGVRVDRDARFDPVLTPRLAASLDVWEGGTLKLAYAEAFRAPSWSETSIAEKNQILAEALQPEKVRSFELGAQQRVGPHRFVIAGFVSRWSSLVEQHALSEAQAIEAIRDGKTSVPFSPGIQLLQYRNVSSIDSYGFNFGADGSFGIEQLHYGLSANVSIAHRNRVEGDEQLTVAPAVFGNARLAYSFGEQLPTVALASSLLGPRRTDQRFYPEGSTWPKAPTLAVLRLTLSGAVPFVKGLGYRLSGNYATAARGPYVIGPVQSATPTQPTPELIPIARFVVFGSLEYQFWTGK
jgi:outer membrane receptor protein involved in Fe transport